MQITTNEAAAIVLRPRLLWCVGGLSVCFVDRHNLFVKIIVGEASHESFAGGFSHCLASVRVVDKAVDCGG